MALAGGTYRPATPPGKRVIAGCDCIAELVYRSRPDPAKGDTRAGRPGGDIETAEA